jgi:hypothetical protein
MSTTTKKSVARSAKIRRKFGENSAKIRRKFGENSAKIRQKFGQSGHPGAEDGKPIF